jgi:hypothetical protein
VRRNVEPSPMRPSLHRTNAATPGQDARLCPYRPTLPSSSLCRRQASPRCQVISLLTAVAHMGRRDMARCRLQDDAHDHPSRDRGPRIDPFGPHYVPRSHFLLPATRTERELRPGVYAMGICKARERKKERPARPAPATARARPGRSWVGRAGAAAAGEPG